MSAARTAAGPGRWIAQAALYAVFAAVVGYFATGPAYRYLPPGTALVRVSFSHAGARKAECRRLTPAEVAALAPNMRRDLDCERGRVPLLLEIDLDGRLLHRASLAPSGLASDGASSAYERFEVAAGPHRITARLRDSRRTEGFDYEASTEVELRPGQSFVVDFSAPTGGFRFL